MSWTSAQSGLPTRKNKKIDGGYAEILKIKDFPFSRYFGRICYKKKVVKGSYGIILSTVSGAVKRNFINS